jgi:hypothetical protein
MEHTPEQQDIIKRIGDVNKRIDEVTAENQANQVAVANSLIDAARALTSTIQQSAEIHRLCIEHGNLFREYLDTLM